MSDPNSTSSDPKPERQTEAEPVAPEPRTGEPSTPAHGVPQEPMNAQEQPPSFARPAEPAATESHSAAEARTEAYPYDRQPTFSQHSADHAATDAYAAPTATEHLLTGPEPTHAYGTTGTAAPVNDPWAGSPQHVEVAEAPKRKGNRWAGISIGIIQALIFAAALFGVMILLDLIRGEQLDILGTLLSPALLMSTGTFFVALVIVALLVNRAGWWAWILGGLFIAVFAYAGWIGGLLAQEAMNVPSNRVLEFVWENLLTWPSIAAFVLGREVPIWFGAWTSARGRKVATRNRAARDEYERQLDEGNAAYR